MKLYQQQVYFCLNRIFNMSANTPITVQSFASPVPNQRAQIPPQTPLRISRQSRVQGIVRIAALAAHPLNRITDGTLNPR